MEIEYTASSCDKFTFALIAKQNFLNEYRL